MSSSLIKVSGRLRPLLAKEEQKSVIWSADGNEVCCSKTGERHPLEKLYDPQSTNEDVFNELKPVLDNVLAGYNGCIVVYGQSGSGKTFTLTGGLASQQRMGLVQYAMNYIVDTISNSNIPYLMKASYIQVYNEKVTDLLNPRTSQADLRISDDGKGESLIEGLSTRDIVSMESVEEIIRQGNLVRETGSTNLNDQSSRSHAILRIQIESGRSDDQNQEGFISTLQMVDLAGSECVEKTGATGKRAVEGQMINRSLLAFSKVVSQLSDRIPHVSYRDSKLTRILKSSLGGNSQTVIICTMNPCDMYSTNSTLQFAKTARKVQLKPVKNRKKAGEGDIQKYLLEIERLKTQLEEKEKTEESNTELLRRLSNFEQLFVGGAHLFAKHDEPTVRRAPNRRASWGGCMSMGPPQPFTPTGLLGMKRSIQLTIPEFDPDEKKMRADPFYVSSQPLDELESSRSNDRPSSSLGLATAVQNDATEESEVRVSLSPEFSTRKSSLAANELNGVLSTLKDLVNEENEQLSATGVVEKVKEEFLALKEERDKLKRSSSAAAATEPEAVSECCKLVTLELEWTKEELERVRQEREAEKLKRELEQKEAMEAMVKQRTDWQTRAQAEKESMVAELERVKDNMRNVEQMDAEHKRMIEHLEERVTVLSEEKRVVETEHNGLKMELENKESEVRRLMYSLKERDEEVIRIQADTRCEVQRIRDDYASKVAEAEQIAKDARGQLSRLMKDMESTADDSQIQVQSLKLEVERLKVELEDEKARHMAAKKEAVAEVQSQVMQAWEKDRETIKQLRQEKMAIETAHKALLDQTVVASDAQSVNEEIDNLKERNKDLEEALEAERESIADREQAIYTLHDEKKRLEVQVQFLKTSVASKDAMAESLKNRLHAVAHEKDEVLDQGKNAIAEVQAEVNRLHKEKSSLEEKLCERSKQYTEAVAKLKEALRSTEAASSQLTRSQADLSAERKKLLAQDVVVAKLTKQLDELKSKSVEAQRKEPMDASDLFSKPVEVAGHLFNSWTELLAFVNVLVRAQAEATAKKASDWPVKIGSSEYKNVEELVKFVEEQANKDADKENSPDMKWPIKFSGKEFSSVEDLLKRIEALEAQRASGMNEFKKIFSDYKKLGGELPDKFRILEP